MRRLRSLGFVLICASAAGAEMVRAQGTCTETADGTCTIGNNNTYAITITITQAVRLQMSSAAIALNAPSALDFDATFGQTTGPTLTMRSNTSWSISIRTTQSLWTASPPPARPNKPAADLQWATASGGPFTDFTLTNATLATGATATAGTLIPLFFRVRYAWLLDTPGSYSIPVQLTVTAP